MCFQEYILKMSGRENGVSRLLPVAQNEQAGPHGKHKGVEARPGNWAGGAGSSFLAAGRRHLDHFISHFYFLEILSLERLRW